MKWHRPALAVVGVLLVAAGLAWRLGQFGTSEEFTLLVAVRCGAGPPPVIAILPLGANGQAGAARQFETASICAAGKIDWERYREGQSLRVSTSMGVEEPVQIVLKPGENIHRERDGFYTVLRIAGEPPLLQADEI